MRPLAIQCEEKRGQPAIGFDGRRTRCARVAAHLSLAVIKLARSCGALEPALAGCLREIAGVLQVRIDASRNTVQLLYNGERGTVEDVHRFLVATGWGEAEPVCRAETAAEELGEG